MTYQETWTYMYYTCMNINKNLTFFDIVFHMTILKNTIILKNKLPMYDLLNYDVYISKKSIAIPL